jgi:hypothetical protein
MRQNKKTLTVIAITLIILVIVLWAWHKNNWWLLLGIPFSLFFFSNAQTVRHSLGFVLTFVLGHIVYTLVSGHFQFAVWSWFFFLCGLMSSAAASLIFGTEESNWEKQAKINGDTRTFEEYEKDKFLNSPEIKEITEKIVDKYKK